MASTAEKIFEQAKALPEAAALEVLDFVGYLQMNFRGWRMQHWLSTVQARHGPYEPLHHSGILETARRTSGTYSAVGKAKL